MPTTLLRQATIVHTPVIDGADGADGDVRRDATTGVVDVLLRDGTIAAVTPATGADAVDTPGSAETDFTIDETIDLTGHLLLPAAVEPHAHLDKAFLAERAENETGDLRGAIDAMIRTAPSITQADIEARAERAALRMASNGYVAVRTHVDVTSHGGLRNVQALVEVRQRLTELIDIEIVALAGTPVTGAAGADHRSLLRGALDAGADLVGGCPHLEPGDATAAPVAAATDVFLQVAVDAGAGLDLHTDETLDPEVMGLEYLAEQVLAGIDLPVTTSHCVSLGQRNASEQRRIAEIVAAAGIGVVTLPHTNLWLGGRDRQPVPRGLTAIDALRRAGVTVAAGADNLQDPFNPLGRACPFETAGLMILAAHDLPTVAWDAVSAASRRVLGRPGGAITPGDPADLLAVSAATLRQAIAEEPPIRRVFRNGVEFRMP